MHYEQPSSLQAAILDWAGTVVDFGSFAPTQIFVEAFAEFGVSVSGRSPWPDGHGQVGSHPYPVRCARDC